MVQRCKKTYCLRIQKEHSCGNDGETVQTRSSQTYLVGISSSSVTSGIQGHMLFQPFQTRTSSMALLPPSLLHVPIIQARIAVQCSHLSFPTRLCTHKSLFFISDFSHVLSPPCTQIINLRFQQNQSGTLASPACVYRLNPVLPTSPCLGPLLLLS